MPRRGRKLDFDRRLMLQFRGSVVTSDAGLLAYRELDDALGLSTMAGETLADARTGKNGRHARHRSRPRSRRDDQTPTAAANRPVRLGSTRARVTLIGLSLIHI